MNGLVTDLVTAVVVTHAQWRAQVDSLVIQGHRHKIRKAGLEDGALGWLIERDAIWFEHEMNVCLHFYK